MKKQDVIRHFSAVGAAPIDLESDVVAFLQANNVRDEFYVWEADIDSRYLRGKLVHWEPWDYNNDWATDFERPRLCADIYVARTLDEYERRLIVCKELLHVVDPPEYRVAATEEIERLVSRIVLPTSAETTLNHDTKTLTDVLGMYEALAVLFPWRVRETLMPAYIEKRISAQQIADYVELPLPYAHVVLSEGWPGMHELLCPTAR